MSAVLAMTYEQDRKKEKANRAWMLRGKDVVAPEHMVLHADLERWGAWCRGGGSGPGSCSSVESMYDTGGREVKRPTITLPPNPLYPRIQRAVWAMLVPQGETIRLYYVRRRAPADICFLYALRFEGWCRWMHMCRDALLCIMRRDGVPYP